MQIQNLQPKTKRRVAPRVGRGGKRGKTAGRGTKGQKARAGHKIRPEIRDAIKKLPKLRGYRFAPVGLGPVEVSLGLLEKHFAAGEMVSPVKLAEKGLLRGSLTRGVKILNNGTLTKALTLSGCWLSAGARAKVLSAGGKIE